MRLSTSTCTSSPLRCLTFLFSGPFLLILALASSLDLISGAKLSNSKIAKNVLESKGEGYCSPSGPIENTLCAYETIEELNKDLFPQLHGMVERDFFRYWKVDLFRECPFWYENGFCMNRDCGVETADESHIPEKWRTKALSQVQISDTDGPTCVPQAQDFCYLDSEAPSSDGQYIDLLLNPERFTGYAGPSAHKVWGAIYEENCFGLGERVLPSYDSDGKVWNKVAGADKKVGTEGGLRGGGGVSEVAGAGKGLVGGGEGVTDRERQSGFGTDMKKTVGKIRSLGKGQAQGTGFGVLGGKNRDEECLEKRVYYKIISGLHASISIHICQDYLDQSTGTWSPNLQCFVTRLASHPDRLANVYFNQVLLLRAIARAAPYLEAYDIETAKSKADLSGIAQDKKVRAEMSRVLDIARRSGTNAFDEGSFFTGPDALELRDEFKHNFRNVSRILDCTGCDKCRLWGKLQISGLGTALKILFELDDAAFDPKTNPNLLQRSEVVALFNTLHRISESLEAVEGFRKLYADTQRAEGKRLEAQQAEAAEYPQISAGAQPTKRVRKPLKRKPKPVAEERGDKSVLAIAKRQVNIYLAKLHITCRQSLWRCLYELERGPLRIIRSIMGWEGAEGKRKDDL